MIAKFEALIVCDVYWSVFVIGDVFGNVFEFGDVFGSARFESSLQSDVKKQLFCNLVMLTNCNYY
jgi:hypothetical protein